MTGEIDASTEQRFRDGLTSVLSDGVSRLVVDLDGVRFLASAGIGVLMGVRRVLIDSGGSLVLAAPHGEVAQVLAMTGVSEVIPVTASVADAAERFYALAGAATAAAAGRRVSRSGPSQKTEVRVA